jgi:hypothetical protein
MCPGHDSSDNAQLAIDANGGALAKSFVLRVNGVNLLTPGAISGLPTIADNTTLLATASIFATSIIRTDYLVGRGVPPVVYMSSGSACSLNGGNGDNGSQVKSSDGKCWLAKFDLAGADVRIWGVAFDGATDNTTALQSAFSWAALGNKLIIPATSSPGRFASPITASLSGPTTAMTVYGGGQDSAQLQYTVPSGTAIAVTESGPGQSTHWRDFTLTTNQTGLANGISLALTGANPNAGIYSISEFTRVTIRGSDGICASNYFATGLIVSSVSGVNYEGLQILGAGNIPAASVGVSLLGVGTAPSVVHNFHSSTINCVGTGIVYPAYVQGVTVDQGNFIDDNDGIKITGFLTVAQLSVTNSSFYGWHAGIWDQAGIEGVQISNNTFATKSNTSYGILLDKYYAAALVGNFCFPQLTVGTGNCISLGVPTFAGGSVTMEANVAFSQNIGIALAAGTVGAFADTSNIAPGTTTPISNLATLLNAVEPIAWTAYAPALACGSGALGAGNVTSGFYKYVATKTITYSFKIILGPAGAGSCVSPLKAVMPILAATGDGNNDYVGTGREIVSGKSLNTILPDGTQFMSIFNYDNTSVIANNASIRVTGTYQTP